MTGFHHVHVDLGTGDGAFALHLARKEPDSAVLGVDTCLDNLTKAARRVLPNLRFLASDATHLPEQLQEVATSITINFPYGALFHVVTSEDSDAPFWIRQLARPGARIDIRVNESAGARYGVPVERIQQRLDHLMRHLAAGQSTVIRVPQEEMRGFPSTWAKRLAWGRSRQVVVASGTLSA
jgi:hypothetical protein